MASKYARAPGQPACKYGDDCYQQSRVHWMSFDHPVTHPRLSGGDDGNSKRQKLTETSLPKDTAAAATAAAAAAASSSFGAAPKAPKGADSDTSEDEEPRQPAPATVPAPAIVPAPTPAAAPPPSVAPPAMTLGKTLRGVPVPPGWGVHDGSLLVWRHMDPSASAKVAAFDFDGCLANTPLGGNDPNAWSMQFPHVPVVLAKLAASGHTLVVVTNESMDRLKKPEAIAACLRKKCGRLEGFAKAAGLPLLVLCATAKDGYRKPGQGCWTFLTSTAYPGLVVDKSASCFVGDAAGRPGDHSDSDRAFAQAAAIPFFDEKTFFLRRHPQGS